MQKNLTAWRTSQKENNMKKISTGFALLLTITVSSLIAGCGSSGDLAQAQPGAHTLALGPTVSGVAAAGAPIVGNAFLKDSSTPAVIKVVAIQNDGTFAFDVKDLKAPFILRAEGMSTGTPQTLHSFAAATGTANINPLSEVALADAAGVSTPANIYANPTPAMMTTINDNLPAAIAALMTKLKPLMDRYGANINPVNDSFTADHTGLDAMFDAVKITLIAGNVVLTNKTSNAVIFNAPVHNMMAGTLNMNAFPAVIAPIPAQAATSALYDTNCAGCHGPLATSSKRGATVARIQAAIAANTGGMGRFSTLSAADIQAIVAALATTGTTASTAPASPSTTPASTVDGGALYATNCAACHGALANSSKLGRTATQIQAAIGSIGAMGSLSTLSTAQVQAIATALTTITPAPAPTDGPTLYSTYCASCHGALASSSKRGVSASTIQSAINSVSKMRTITLTSAQIQNIANALK
jgi:mono/diheme cytochrome c family protein